MQPNNRPLTELRLQALKPSDDGIRLSEPGGISGIIRSKNGGISVSFRFRYKQRGKQNDIRIGSWPNTSLKQIRAARDEVRALLRAGIDPVLEKRLNRERKLIAQIEEEASLAKIKARLTVLDLFDSWKKTDLVRRKDGGKEIKRMFEKDVLPILGGMAIEDVGKVHIISVTDKLLDRGVNRMAKLILSLVRQMFRFAVDRDLIEVDPTARIQKSKVGGKTVERERHLSESEIRELVIKLPSANLLQSTQCALWIALSTLCRIGSLSKAQWAHIDLDKKTWFIPAENSKGGKPYTIALSEFATNKFRLIDSLKQSDVWVFPNTDNTSHTCEKNITKQVDGRQNATILKKRTKANTALVLPGGKWTPHDLRRTGSTLMGELGVLPGVIERCLNHVEEDKMKRIYQRQQLISEKGDAWRRLGEKLEMLTITDAGAIHTNPVEELQ